MFIIVTIVKGYKSLSYGLDSLVHHNHGDGPGDGLTKKACQTCSSSSESE